MIVGSIPVAVVVDVFNSDDMGNILLCIFSILLSTI